MNYTLKRFKRSKSIKVRVEPDGSVLVTAPHRVAKRKIESFVSQSEPWIKKQKRHISSKKSAYPLLDWENNQVRYLGELYPVEFSSESYENIRLENGVLTVHPLSGEERDIPETVLVWLKRKARDHLRARVAELAEEMNLPFNSLKIRQQKSRWGSCSAKKNLNFNWRLIHFKKEIIDYVIIHELSHLKHLNHSTSFWNLVAQFDPDYLKHRRFLKDQVMEIA